MKKSILFYIILITVYFTLYIEDCFCQWMQTNGPYAGTIISLCNNGSYIFAGTDGEASFSGIYRSTNSGLNWIQTNLQHGSIYSLAANGSNIFAGASSRIYRSTDNGSTWTTSQLNSHEVFSLAISGSNIFAGSAYYSFTGQGGVWLSTNNGISWNLTSLNYKTVKSLAISGNSIFAGTQNSGVYLSTNNGSTWTQTSLSDKTVYSLAVNSNCIFAGTGTYNNNGGVYLSFDNGTTWKRTSLTGQNVWTLAMNSNGIFAGADSGVYFSSNNGTTWTQTSLYNKRVYSLAVNNGCILAGMYGQGIYLSTNNGTSWGVTGLNCKIIYSFSSGNEYIFTGTRNGIHRSSDIGQSWEKVTSGGDFYTINSLMDWNGSSIYIAENGEFMEPYCNLSHSTNNGTNWINDWGNMGTISSIAAKDSNIFCGVGFWMSAEDLVYSTDYGNSWNHINLGIEIRSLAINDLYIFAGTTGNGVYLSTNKGTNWAQTALNNRTVCCFAISGSNIFTGTENSGVYHSTNNGTNWTQTSLNNLTIRSLAVIGSNVFAGTDSTYTNNDGIYLSTDNGSTWTQKNEGFNNIPTINALLIKSGYLLAGTNGQSVWRRPISDIITGIQTVNDNISEKYELQQNYPNPFNLRTIIKYQIQTTDFVSLKIFDMLGREVVTLINEKLQPGTYKTEFDGGNLPSGVYFYQLLTKDFSSTKKLILLK